MREIQFRGKRVVNGEWIYGHYKYSKIFNEHIIVCYGDCVSYTVIPETVGQYTGLKDRDGVEIYEGDILRNVDNPYVDKLPFAVWWNEYYGAWFWWSELGDVGTDRFYQSIASGCEVIGTLYDNPELMGEKK